MNNLTKKPYLITAARGTDRIDLARWLRAFGSLVDTTLPRSLETADDLLAGNDIERFIDDVLVAAAPKGVALDPVVYENPYAAHFKQQEEYLALRDKGAGGDAEAAIAYCKLEAEGIVSHNAFG